MYSARHCPFYLSSYLRLRRALSPRCASSQWKKQNRGWGHLWVLAGTAVRASSFVGPPFLETNGGVFKLASCLWVVAKGNRRKSL